MKINNHDIRIQKGEAFDVRVRVMEHGELYTMKLGDRIQFVVKKLMIDSEKAVIDRTSVGSDVVRVKASDTANLMCGKYRYMVRLIKSDGSKHVLVDTHNFEITGGGV